MEKQFMKLNRRKKDKMVKKIFRLDLSKSPRFSSNQMIGLAKAMSKTNGKIKTWRNDLEDGDYIDFEINENYPIFQKQLESYAIIVKELNKQNNKND